MTIWMEDKKTGISCGINADGDLFLGNSTSGYNLADTPQNRQMVKKDFYRYKRAMYGTRVFHAK